MLMLQILIARKSEVTMPQKAKASPSASTWSSLNARQQAYLGAIFDADQAVEQAENSRWSRGGRRRPADQWRWMIYCILDGCEQPVMAHLHQKCTIDEGTGSTFAALARRNLIEIREIWEYEYMGERVIFPEAVPLIKITPTGRRLIREARSLSSSRLVTGTLREWHWRALALAYQERDGEGVRDLERGYGNIGWGTWLRLRDYQPAALVKEQRDREGKSRIKITPFGQAYYLRSQLRYASLYPDVSIPPPEEPVHPFDPYIEISTQIAVCRACRRMYRQEETATFQLQKNQTWKVEKSFRSLGAATENLYGEKLIPCFCQTEDIQEWVGSFAACLEQLAAMAWRIWFPDDYHTWYRYLPYLAEHYLEKQPTYDPAEVRRVFLPLLAEANDLHINIADGSIRFIYNERVGRGALYGILKNGTEHFAPAALTAPHREE
jgi:hypothetical protein